MPAVGKGLFWAKLFLKACSELCSQASKISQNIYMFKETEEYKNKTSLFFQ